MSNARTAETAITTALIERALELGYAMQVFDEGESILDKTTNKQEVMDLLGDLDEAYVTFFKGSECLGSVFFVFGNDGYDVICSHHENAQINNLVQHVTPLIEKYEEELTS